MEVLEEVRARDRETPIFMITAYGSVEVAVDALKRGANDYFSKPWDNEKLLIEIDRMIAEAAPGARKHRAQARAQAALQLPQHRRQERADAEDPGPGGAGGRQPRDHPDHRRNRHRQGTDRQRDPCALGARRASVCAGALRLGAAGSAGIGAVRPRQGSLHRRDPGRKGLLRSRQSRHDFLRRDRHHFAGNADQAAARDPGERVHAAGLDRNHPRGRAHRGRHQRRSEEAGGGRQVPRGSLLPPERDQPGAAAAARPQGRYSARWSDHFFTKYCRENEKFLDDTGRSRAYASSRTPCRS